MKVWTAAELLAYDLTRDDVEPPEPDPIAAVELVRSGECHASCLLAVEQENACNCRCGGSYHGALAHAVVEPVRPWWDDLGEPVAFERAKGFGQTYRSDSGWTQINMNRRKWAIEVYPRRLMLRDFDWPEEVNGRFVRALLRRGRADFARPGLETYMERVYSYEEAKHIGTVLEAIIRGDTADALLAIAALER